MHGWAADADADADATDAINTVNVSNACFSNDGGHAHLVGHAHLSPFSWVRPKLSRESHSWAASSLAAL